jgi:hypothetical protein
MTHRTAYYMRDGLWRMPEDAPSPELKASRNERLQRRKTAGSTAKPCPGCGRTGGRNFRPADDVCDECLVLMWDGEDARHQRQAALSGDLELLRLGVRRWSENSPAWPHWYAPHHSGRDELVELNCAVADLLWLLIGDRKISRVDLSAGRGRFVPKSMWNTGGRPTDRALLPAGAGDLIERVDAAAQAVIDITYEAGVDRGRSLLSQLAAGEITAGEFDSAVVRRRG